MEQLRYVYTFINKIKWWLLVGPLLIAGLAIIFTRQMNLEYTVESTIYTGVVSGYGLDTEEASNQNWNMLTNTLENIINIITSKETLKDVGLRLYVQDMIHGDPNKDNTYIKASNYNKLVSITPKEVLDLIDKTSEEKTLENLLNYEKSDSKNFIYGLLNWHHQHYSYEALSKISVKKLGGSDMLQITYSANDPGIAYNTLLILNQSYKKEYTDIQFGTTNNVIRYLEQELEKVSYELRSGEDSLTNYNIENRVINYDEQTKQVAAYDKDFELIYQDALLRYNSSKALVDRLEVQIAENITSIRNNSEFIVKLHKISDLRSKVAGIESFVPDTLISSTEQKQLSSYKRELRNAESDLRGILDNLSNQKYTKDGYPTSNFISQWLDELLKNEKASAELKVLNQRRSELNDRYLHFSPIGSTIKRKERSIDFLERSYLSILTSLNTARLRLKSLEMNSASLKVLNPPIYPLMSKPTKRKAIVSAAYMGSFIFILGLFMMKELFDRRLLNKIRTERITSGKVLGAYPGNGRLGKRIFRQSYENAATLFLSNTLLNYLGDRKPSVINFISIDKETPTSHIADTIIQYWIEKGLISKKIEWNEQSSLSSTRKYLLAKDVSDISSESKDEDIIIMEFPPLRENSISRNLLQKANLNLLLLDSNKSWHESDQVLFDELKRLSGDVPVMLLLTNADYTTVKEVTGMTSFKRNEEQNQ